MKSKHYLKWQALVDGELNPSQEASLRRRIEGNPEARQCADELTRMRDLLRANEVERKLPVSGDFYWSQIENRLNLVRDGSQRPSAPTRLWLWWRWLVPAAAACLLALLSIHPFHNSQNTVVADEIETQLTMANFFTFRSQSDGISVVWVDTKAGQALSSYPEELDYMMQ
jgi:anti-sigma factor RsiW